MKEKLIRFMQGRYGTDKLNNALWVTVAYTVVREYFVWNLCKIHH